MVLFGRSKPKGIILYFIVWFLIRLAISSHVWFLSNAIVSSCSVWDFAWYFFFLYGNSIICARGANTQLHISTLFIRNRNTHKKNRNCAYVIVCWTFKKTNLLVGNFKIQTLTNRIREEAKLCNWPLLFICSWDL